MKEEMPSRRVVLRSALLTQRRAHLRVIGFSPKKL